MQALARAGERLADPALTQAARRARWGRSSSARRDGVRVPQASGDWYALYSFAPRAVRPERAPAGGERPAHLRGADAATRRCSSVSRPATRPPGSGSRASTPGPGRSTAGPPGSPGRRRTSTTTPSTATSRATCARAPSDPPTAVRPTQFTRYLKEDPTLDPQRAVPSPATGGRGVRFKFRLSKIGRVGSRRALRRTARISRPARRSRAAIATSAGSRRRLQARAHVRVHAVRTRPCGQLVLA